MAKRRQPNSRLRAERLNRGWTQNGLVERIHQAAASRGLPEPRGLDANYVSRWERGMAPELYHGYLLSLTFQLPPAALDLPEECLPTAARLEMEIDTKHTATESENRMKRRELMKATIGTVLVGTSVVKAITETAPATGGSLPAAFMSEQECGQRLAWEMWQRGVSAVHLSELPHGVAAYLAPHRVGVSPGGLMTCDEDGNCSFVTPSLVDLFVAQRIFAEVTNRNNELLASGQTSHETDWIIGQLARRHKPAIHALIDWMSEGSTPIVRVNSAGILAKLGSADVANRVVRSLHADDEVRRLYLTAVLHRVLKLDWEAAAALVADTDLDGKELVDRLPEPRLTEAAVLFADEVHNPRDSAARWCSTLLLSQLKEAAPETAMTALQEALERETSHENARAISAALAGSAPIPA